MLDLWKDADPGIPEVENAKKRLAGLMLLDDKQLLAEKKPEKVAQIWHKSETGEGRSPAIPLFSLN